ncbi:NAC domain-containing protein 17-like isoform X3 [Cynara cardunculus var. scolymus]|nr:NAC domain-containing protein 17-like isoform X3 [Cynara cardunculus var. scolymus]
MNGYWKATGKDRIIKRRSCSVGIKKTLVYYQGRAPSGQRTDWVMHEYTVDEEELKRCPFAQEHYVLYKIFKKSGPGPKNGEQYGAPFVEEEWSDDDCLDVDALLVQKLNPIPVNDFRTGREEEETMLSSDIMEFLNKIIDEPEILPPLPQLLEEGQEFSPESCSTKDDAFGFETPSGPSHEQQDVQPRSEPQPLVVNEDFLEMDDLIGPEPSIHNFESFAFPNFDSFSEFDLYHDSTRFADTGSFGTQQIQLQAAFLDNVEYGTENSGLVSEVINHHHDELPISYDLWEYDQGDSSIMTAQTTHKAISQPSSGVVIEENPGKAEYCVNETNMDNGTSSWFSSALWAFVEAIPTTPASASESSALVNRAFERMSSFGRGRNVNVAAAVGVSTSKRLEKKASSSRGIVYFSVLGVLLAILWVLVGTCMELLGR